MVFALIDLQAKYSIMSLMFFLKLLFIGIFNIGMLCFFDKVLPRDAAMLARSWES